MKRACGHCGLDGPVEEKGPVLIWSKTEFIPEYGDFETRLYLSVLHCSACNETTIWKDVWSPDIGEPVWEEQLAPGSRDNSAVPDNVQRPFDAARRVKKIEPGLFAVGIRRTLEAVCNDQSATGSTLYAQLEDLVSQGRIPGTLGQMAHQLREFGNFGAHDDELEVGKEDVSLIEDFADAILEYVYRAPAKLDLVRQTLMSRQAPATDAAQTSPTVVPPPDSQDT